MSGFSVEVRDLTVRYPAWRRPATTALDGLSLTLEPGRLHGLLGRNGSGKTTLLSVLAAFRRPTAGAVLVDGEDPWENARVMSGVCLVRESGDVQGEVRLRDTVRLLEQVRPTFDRSFAESLMDTFELDPRATPTSLSRGKRSAFGVVVGLASRAPLTLLDEVHLGMDAPSRYAFYDALLADYVEHPRTVVLSSHLIDEVQRMLEHVVVLDRGRVLLADDADDLRASGTSVVGPDTAVDAFVAGRRVLSRRSLGRTVQVTVFGRLAPDDVAAASAAGLELGPVDLQDLFVDLTAKEGVR
ncbi:ATP-binding cassette domain-containing protein [Cellulomonas carbonis]|uniref:ABC transporter n=1 Tax=Cellulomonas carbonis T26 TaxID=947969 RepID=A0A0A0BVQ7_9CELL|nr:ABC transporter ATP-binding protein [Cellulomonas carbonis]KGM12070.1 ABC transporter [Cellulomonas carbonis T26]GGC08219.1 ABC transporter [Cellulomonas carbonis]